MKALTICQPYAHLIVTPADELPPTAPRKLVENRRWETRHRGPLLIHAGKSRDWLQTSRDGTLETVYGLPVEDLVFGAIVGVVELLQCFHVDVIRAAAHERDWLLPAWQWLRTHPHVEGPYCWVLGEARRFTTPIPWRGEQGLFDVEERIVATALEEARRAPR